MFIWGSKDKKTLYAIFLGKPKVGERVNMSWFRGESHLVTSPIKRIVVLGTDITAKWEDTGRSCYLTVPDPMNEWATVFKFELE